MLFRCLVCPFLPVILMSYKDKSKVRLIYVYVSIKKMVTNVLQTWSCFAYVFGYLRKFTKSSVSDSQWIQYKKYLLQNYASNQGRK
jgi:hypothetical protein